MDEGIQSRRETDVQARDNDKRLQSGSTEREKAIKALSAEIMDAYGLCRTPGLDAIARDRS